jgi:5-formyltetrahydrofolate cyclo-ligase
MAAMREETDAADGLRTSKEALRGRMRAVRGAIPEADRLRRSQDVSRLLLTLPEAAGVRRIFTFLSFGSEVSTAPAIGAFRERGAAVAVPVLEAGRMEAVDLAVDTRLVPSGYGALEPVERVAVRPQEIDLVVAPGLAFDRAGRRLGYGGGYFDAFLPRLRRDCPVVGICFREQVVDAVPAGPADRPVSVVVTDAEVIRPADGGPLL